MIPTRRLSRAVALLATALASVLLAGCATAPVTTHHELTIVPAAVAAVQTKLVVDGVHRAVSIRDVTAPSGLVPALILLHGAGSSSAKLEAATGMTAVAKKDGFVVAYGEGTSIGRPTGGGAWNAGACCGKPVIDQVNDIGYLTAVMDTLVADHDVDPNRIYLGGFSNGGMMTYKAACDIGTRLAGIVVVSGALNVKNCDAQKALPVLVIHGIKDPTVPYAGGVPNPRTAARIGSWVNTSVAYSSGYWATRDGCVSHTDVVETRVLTDDAYSGCASGTKLQVISVLNGVHRWPTTIGEGFDASDYIAKYFGLAS